MPSRQNIKTIVTPEEIQGEGAWVKIRNITVNEAEELQQKSVEIDKELQPERERLLNEFAKENNLEVDKLTDTQKIIALSKSELVKKAKDFFNGYFSEYVIEWNWVTEKLDAKSNEPIPMEQPFHNPDVFGTLTAQESDYIQSLFKQSEKSEKN